VREGLTLPRIAGRSAYSCQFCGHHVYPTAGTIFHKSRCHYGTFPLLAGTPDELRKLAMLKPDPGLEDVLTVNFGPNHPSTHGVLRTGLGASGAHHRPALHEGGRGPVRDVAERGPDRRACRGGRPEPGDLFEPGVSGPDDRPCAAAGGGGSRAKIKSKPAKKKAGGWVLVGPEGVPASATVAGESTAGTSKTVFSGRTTALAVSPACTSRTCPMLLGAAGGGI
jgi:hypothetical protein